MIAASTARRGRSTLLVLIVTTMALGCGVLPARSESPRVRFVRDTTIAGMGLPFLGECWSADGRSFVLLLDSKLVLFRAETLSVTRELEFADHVRSSSWAPDGSTIACVARRHSLLVGGTDVYVASFSKAPALAAVATQATVFFWLGESTLGSWSDMSNEFAALKPFPVAAVVDSRALRRHALVTGGQAERLVAVLEDPAAPDSALPIAQLPGYSRLDQPSGEAFLLKEWNPVIRRYLASRQRPQWHAVLVDSLGRETASITSTATDLSVHTLACGGELALGTPVSFSESGPGATALFAVSLSEHWRTEVSGLPRGCFGAVASPVGNRVLIESPDGLLLGRLEVSR